MRANRQKPLNLAELELTVRNNQGISSLELGHKTVKLVMTVRSLQAIIYKQSMKYLKMGDKSPIFFQKIGGKKLWYTMDYAIKHKLERKPPPPEPIIDETLIVKDESQTLTLRQICINKHWITGRLT